MKEELLDNKKFKQVFNKIKTYINKTPNLNRFILQLYIFGLCQESRYLLGIFMTEKYGPLEFYINIFLKAYPPYPQQVIPENLLKQRRIE